MHHSHNAVPNPPPTQGDYKILCDDGCREWTSANYKDGKCNNGESASQAVVVRSDYADTAEGKAVLSAMGTLKTGGEWCERIVKLKQGLMSVCAGQT